MDVMILDVNGIQGDSQIKGFKGKIEVLSFSHGVAMQVGNDYRGSRTGGSPNHQDFALTKHLDLASVPLVDACNRGKNLGTVKLIVGRSDRGTVVPVMTYQMENVVVSSVSISGGNGAKPVETITLNYSKITWTYSSQKPAGDETASWNLATNRPG
jgi:type VI secretion system secreted protein Hcp